MQNHIVYHIVSTVKYRIYKLYQLDFSSFSSSLPLPKLYFEYTVCDRPCRVVLAAMLTASLSSMVYELFKI